MTTVERERTNTPRGADVPPPYDPQTLEPGWQKRWQAQGLHATEEGGGKPKFYCLDFFPYPSGDGLSVGHCRNYVPTDTLSRYMRARGHNVLHPMGWDAFGEPTEQYAERNNISPRAATDRNTANYKRQFDLIGCSYDWSREIDSSDPNYYKWTQSFFLLLHQRGLAYRATQWQWWCPSCRTTLSNQEAQGGVCWRGHTGLTKKEIPAWYFKITEYADQLLEGLSQIEWPERIKLMQENWIGRSEGTEIEFRSESGIPLPVFTTRPDTVFGVTFMVIAPEHPLVDRFITPEHRAEVQTYIDRAKATSEIDRLATDREKTGVFTGSHAINPLNGERVQLWVADYVLATYGTGVVMGVPAHDTRDFAFAKQYGVPIKLVIQPPHWPNTSSEGMPDAYIGPGTMVNSGEFDGTLTYGDWKKLSPQEKADVARQWNLDVQQVDEQVAKAPENGIEAVSRRVQERGLGKHAVNYRMRDWLISRQRYWGAPIPIVYCATCGEVPVPEDHLPVELPPMVDFMPDGTGRAPLARAIDWVRTTCPTCGGSAERETDTMGGFACSSWYFLRFCSPDYQQGPFDPQRAAYWMPVDQYVGGAEHAVLHLLYARFWTRVMHDAGLISFQEPFYRLRNQGMLVVSTPHRRSQDPTSVEDWLPIAVEEAERLQKTGEEVEYRSAKMSKSLRNVITPDEMVAKYGADSLRMYEMFMAPFDQEVEWSEEGINGQRRFLGRVWNLVSETWQATEGEPFEGSADEPLTRLRHKTVKKVSEDLEQFRFNTMVAALMTFANALGERYRAGTWKTAAFQEGVETLVRLLSPSAPFIAEGLWQLTGGFGRGAAGSPFAGNPDDPFGSAGSVHQQPWPAYDEALTHEDVATIVIQINGKVRDRMDLPVDTDESTAREAALERPRVQEFVTEPSRAKFIYVKGRLLNIVIR
jgi:leucyl-tRNA synthetase